jgi:glycosyltransferase involved in cell wall biosynthesis
MRVLMTADAVGGVWTYALELADALAPHGVSVVLATMGPAPDDAQRRAAAASAVAAVHESTFPLEWEERAWCDVDEAGQWLLQLEEELQPDVVHLNGYAHGALPWHAPAVVVGHSCVASWWSAVHGTAPPPEWDEYRRRVAAGLGAAADVVAPTAAMLSELRRWYGIGHGHVVPNCRRSDWAAPATAEPLILTAGRVWDEAKNIAAVTRVAGALPWPVAVAGGGDAAPGVVALGRIPFPELCGWLQRASVFVLPARYEPFGLGPLEAGLARCALVLGDIPSLREVWGDAAHYVDPDDEAALADTLRRLIADPDLRHASARRARDRALGFSPERTAAGYLEVYDRLRSLHHSGERR